MNPSRVHSQPSPGQLTAIGLRTCIHTKRLQTQTRSPMQDTSPRPVGCSGLAFRELIQPTLPARASWTWTGLVKMNGIS
jgi:hypothetical protein